MSENLILEGTEDTPKIEFDKAGNVFKIAGRSYPENAREFYQTALDWLVAYSAAPNPATCLEVELEYFNSGSVKEVFKLMYVLEDIQEAGHEAKVIWHYKEGDQLMLQKGEEFQSFLEVPVELKVR